MNINATLLGQMLTFSIFVWVTVRYVWPPLEQALQEREDKIASGLKAAERGELALEEANRQAKTMLADAKAQAHEVLKEAQHTASQMVATAKDEAAAEKQRIIASAKTDLEASERQARQALMREVVDLVIRGSERLIADQLDANQSAKLVTEALAQLSQESQA